MNWPRGRWNGLPIRGASLKITVNVDYWHWIPIWGERPCLEAFIALWLCFRLSYTAEYGTVWRSRGGSM